MERSIKHNVMRRVRTIHAVRPFTSGTAVAAVFLVLSLYAIGRFVFVAQVFRNMPALENVSGMLQFMATAFANTDLIVQVLTILVALSALWVLRDIGRYSVGRLA